MADNEKLKIISKIVERADNLGLLMFDRFSLFMDLDVADKEFNLRLEQMLNADDANFGHDIVGIQNNINRKTCKIENSFVPRFAGAERG